MTDGDNVREIPGFSNYQAFAHPVELGDTAGQILSFRSGRLLRSRVSNRGYLLVNLTDDAGMQRTVTVHTLILRTFAGERPARGVARHLNDDPLDNRWPENLAWGTQGDNERDKYANGRPRPVPPGPRRGPWLRGVLSALRGR